MRLLYSVSLNILLQVRACAESLVKPREKRELEGTYVLCVLRMRLAIRFNLLKKINKTIQKFDPFKTDISVSVSVQRNYRTHCITQRSNGAMYDAIIVFSFAKKNQKEKKRKKKHCCVEVNIKS